MNKICAFCGEQFQTTNPTARYCSDAHRMKAYRRRKKQTAKPAPAASPVQS